jgi:hypothetical protein
MFLLGLADRGFFPPPPQLPAAPPESDLLAVYQNVSGLRIIASTYILAQGPKPRQHSKGLACSQSLFDR